MTFKMQRDRSATAKDEPDAKNMFIEVNISHMNGHRPGFTMSIWPVTQDGVFESRSLTAGRFAFLQDAPRYSAKKLAEICAAWEPSLPRIIELARTLGTEDAAAWVRETNAKHGPPTRVPAVS